MTIIDGKKIATEILGELKSLPKPEKFMAGVLVGDDPVSLNFLQQKEKTAKELGIDFRLYTFSSDLKNDELRNEVGKIAKHGTCGGVIVQLPLPGHLNRHYILNVVPREKDVDVLGERALGAFYAGRNPVLPPAVGTVEKVLEVSGIKSQASRVAIVGLGLLVGRPIGVWLMEKAKELYLLHRGSGLEILKNADLIISGTGQAGLIKPEMLRDGAGVIDFGYSVAQAPPRTDADSTQTNAETKKISGDFDAEALEHRTSNIEHIWYTPTPGGTGPILIAKLFENFFTLNQFTEKK